MFLEAFALQFKGGCDETRVRQPNIRDELDGLRNLELGQAAAFPQVCLDFGQSFLLHHRVGIELFKMVRFYVI